MKILIFVIGLSVLINFNLNAQQLPNGGFENWSQQIFNEPDTFLSSNIMWGVNNVTKVTDSYHASFAAKLETVLSNNDTIPGMLLIGTPGNQTINGGLPYTWTPDSISGYVKYEIQPNDTAFFIVAFKKNGTFIGQPVITTFIGTQLSYVRFVIPTGLLLSNPPDSMVAIITCSSMDPPQFAGSTLTIDSISFTNTSEPFPNGDFENWTTISTGEDPSGWGTYANQFPYYNLPVLVTKTIDANSGSFAVKLISDTGTVPPPFGTGVPGDTLLGTLQLNLINGFSSTKYPFAYKPDSLVGYTKGTVAPDTNNFNFIMVQLSNNGTTIGQAFYFTQNSSNTYSRFATNFSYTSGLIPDSMQFIIFAGNPGDPIPGNVFYVDDLSFIYNPLNINDISEKTTFKIYPNPVKDNLNIFTYSNEETFIKIYNIVGEIILEAPMNMDLTTVSASDLSAGLFFYQILNKNGNILDAGKFIKE